MKQTIKTNNQLFRRCTFSMGNFPLWGIPVGIRQEEQLQVLTRPATLNSGPRKLHYKCFFPTRPPSVSIDCTCTFNYTLHRDILYWIQELVHSVMHSFEPHPHSTSHGSFLKRYSKDGFWRNHSHNFCRFSTNNTVMTNPKEVSVLGHEIVQHVII